MPKILVVDDDASFCLMLKSFFSKNGMDAAVAFSLTDGLKAATNSVFDIILTDYRLPDGNGVDLLSTIKRNSPDTVVILMTGYADIKIAVNAIKMGAFEYVAKPINPDEILHIIKSGLESTSKQKAKPAQSKNPEYIEGKCEAAKKVQDYINLVGPTEMSVLILGESGTGKEYAARRIHQFSKRKNTKFVAVDCGALPKDIAGSELFGHVKGSFTGAVNDKIGHFEEANGGTIFLDEIGNLSYDVQVNLLRAIQERKIRRIGSTQETSIDVRIISATNEDLKNALKTGEFREDLYHRLNEFSINLPPLRERKEDLLDFVNYFKDKAAQEFGKRNISFDQSVIDVFMRYEWPGNIREMKNVVRRAVLLASNNIVTTDSLPEEMLESSLTPSSPTLNTDAVDLKSIKEKSEQELIISTIVKAKYNKSQAAKLLGIDRKTLYNKLKQYGIDI
ncbi:sigma-54 dependent transcriptional regulator [uncultured Acetobacteroides sp.]|uniref:sigma-54-dependent transcriptional regulator n=1 Tax=uncultured Acetobacteroides sp. TaxID=1760811 RepID=UPI0029F4F1C7|nr:sigma-54 dependent transcriptional regulator [uncultured Acetobacteroides sp.]